MRVPVIPDTQHPVIIRTDFTDNAAWKAFLPEIQRSYSGFKAYIEVIDHADYSGASVSDLLTKTSDYKYNFLFIADSTTLSQAEHPILCVDLGDVPGRSFRVIPSELWSVENNLSIANMDYEEFFESTDPDGIFRGF